LGLGADHPWFGYHAWAAMLAAGALVLRVVWGFAGTRHARFAAWSWRPSALFGFAMAQIGRRPRPNYASHNPAASWVMLGLLGMVGALVGTGLAGGDDPHEGLAVVLLVFIGLHLAGLAWHSFHHRENIALAMVDGRKVAPEAEALPHASGKAGAVIVVALVVWTVLLARGYDHAAGTLKLPFLKHPLVLTDGAGEDGEEED
jgi:cytochrome b